MMAEESPDVKRAREGVHAALDDTAIPIGLLIGTLERWRSILPTDSEEGKRIRRLAFRARNLEALICKLGADVDK